MDVAKHNQEAWDGLVRSGNRWTVPVSSEQVAAARRGDWYIILTPEKPVPREWFGDLQGQQVLCLAGGGGQQGPVLAAAGATVTVFDNSDAQLNQDRMVAARDGLNIRTIQGDMRDLIGLQNDEFDLIVHPCSNGFVPDINPVWREAWRVLKPGGKLMSGFINPLLFLFDYWQLEKGLLEVRYRVPFADATDLDKSQLQELMDQGEPLSWGHTLEDQIGGQLRAGFELIAMYEDGWSEPPVDLLSKFIDPMMATLSRKPA